jgi:hypothetical protein
MRNGLLLINPINSSPTRLFFQAPASRGLQLLLNRHYTQNRPIECQSVSDT